MAYQTETHKTQYFHSRKYHKTEKQTLIPKPCYQSRQKPDWINTIKRQTGRKRKNCSDEYVIGRIKRHIPRQEGMDYIGHSHEYCLQDDHWGRLPKSLNNESRDNRGTSVSDDKISSRCGRLLKIGRKWKGKTSKENTPAQKFIFMKELEFTL